MTFERLKDLGIRGATGLGKAALFLGTGGISGIAANVRRQQEQLEQQREQQLGINRILSGQTIPAFARPGGAEPRPAAEIRDVQLGQLAQLPPSASLNKLIQELSPLGKEPEKRRILKDVSGFQRFAETGERVFPGAQAEETEGPFRGTGFQAQLVNQRTKDLITAGLPPDRARQKAINDVLATQSDILTTDRGTFAVPRRGFAPIQEQIPTGDRLPLQQPAPIPAPGVLPGVLPGVPAGARLLAPPKGISKKAQSQFRTSRDQLRGGITAVGKLIAEIEESPTKAGLVGGGREILETTLGVGGDILSLLPGFGLVKQAVKALTPVPEETIKALKPLQNKLITAIARARLGATGRLTDVLLKAAREDTTIKGKTSSAAVLGALRQIEKELNDSLLSLGGRAEEAGFELPAPRGKAAQRTTFTSIQEAEAANLPVGTEIIINGRRAIVE